MPSQKLWIICEEGADPPIPYQGPLCIAAVVPMGKCYADQAIAYVHVVRLNDLGKGTFCLVPVIALPSDW